jgi:Ca2+-binding RTX toxin-like protein
MLIMSFAVPEAHLIILDDEVNYTLASDPTYLNVFGNALNNQITGTSNNNELDGGGGVDTLIGGVGNDTYWVDQPNDFAGLVGDTIIELAGEGIDTVRSSAGYALGANVENLVLVDNPDIPLTDVISGFGNNLNNSITGNRNDNDLHGQAGNDVLNGGLGEDTLYGGAGKDTLKSGTGRDVFVVDTRPNKATNLDKITDYNVKYDTVWLNNAIFTKIGANGALKAGAFWTNNTGKAHDRDDRVIYDKTSGVLYYDADGTGSGKAVAFATISKNLPMTSKDFYIV